MMKRLTSGQFSRRALFLFFIVSLLPAITVSVTWYMLTRDSGLVFVGRFVAPVAILGLGPAVLLGVLFAELLAIPIRKLHQAIIRIGRGDLKTRVHFSRISEFREMGDAINAIAVNLQQTISEKEGENAVMMAERNKLTSVLNNMSDGVFALDRTDRILMFNRAASKITGRSIATVAGQPLEQVLPFHKRGTSVLVDWLAKADSHTSQSHHWGDLELATIGGEIRRVSLEIVTTPQDPNGIRALGTFHDLTKDLELEDKELNFVALAAHELRTPLTTIKGYLDILDHEIGEDLDVEHRQVLQRSMMGVNELTHLINNLLNVSRIESGELSYQFIPTNWADFMKDLETELRRRTQHHNRKLVINIPEKVGLVNIDHIGISEVFYNLVDNAIHYTKNGDTISIESQTTHDGISTTVTDPGEGIPKEAQAHLFEKFYRAGGLRSKGGTGLGLYICKQMAEAHHGYMWAESEPGKGSTFGLHLPFADLLVSANGNADNKTKIIRGTHGWIKTHSNN